MSKLESLKGAAGLALMAAALVLQPAGVHAHHNSQAEFGAFGSETIAVEGTIVDINWGNPHISIDIRTTGGDLPAGQNWRLVSHPVQIMNDYGFMREEFAVGDRVKLLGWKNVRGAPQIWPRAIQVNDGPMKSNLRFTDMIDIAKGVFESLHIQPAANLNGSPPARAGEETVAKLKEMGLIDEKGLMIWPPR
ncbi:MAG TPA: DUF6152 family protein [Gammaproteobacteria bacterium]|jgi:hypothetical protein|nr:DUF6152 family protein [Gammaproteobacteria bacterium]